MTKTSTQVKRRYNRSVYVRRLDVEIKKELVAEWKAALAEDGLTQAGFIREAMLKYLHERKKGGGAK